jgi:predicted MFS family arabinose efflux permease
MIEPTTPMAARPSTERLAWQVGTATLSRLLLNTSRRFIYPFAPALSRGLGVPLPAITSLIALNQAAGLFSPVFGPLGDRWGYRVMMLAGLSMLAVGMTASGILPYYGVLVLAVLLAGLGKSLYDPALQAYVGERVPYRRRGLVIGVIEFSWAGSSLIGIPLVGLLIDGWGWQAPFLVLGGLAILSVIVMAIVIPADGRRQHPARSATSFGQAWRILRGERAALGAVGFIFFTNLANDNLFVVYGLWLEQNFALSVVALGTATTVIGVAELIGEGLTATISDRIGLVRAVLIGLVLSTLSYALLPLMGHSLPAALAGLFLTFITFEFTIVTAFSLFTEVLPQARGTMMSSLLAAAGVGRMTGALIGGLIWFGGGILAVGLTSALVSGLSLLSLWWGLRHWQAQGDS